MGPWRLEGSCLFLRRRSGREVCGGKSQRGGHGEGGNNSRMGEDWFGTEYDTIGWGER